jgi:phosphoenolpyruvate phosphomutase
MTKLKILRNLFSSNKLIRVMGTHNALSAKLVEKSGFDAVWASGLEISTSYALPNANRNFRVLYYSQGRALRL